MILDLFEGLVWNPSQKGGENYCIFPAQRLVENRPNSSKERLYQNKCQKERGH